MSSPPTAKGRETRARLLDSARELFGRLGYANVRITDITRGAGLSSGAFYRYFVDRRSLLLVLLEDVTEEAFGFAHYPWDAQRPMESVLQTTQRYFEFYERNRALLGVLVELSQADPEIREIWARSRRAFYARITHALQRGARDGVVRSDIDINVAAELLGSMTEFYAFQRFTLEGDALKPIPAATAAYTLSTLWASGIFVGTPAE